MLIVLSPDYIFLCPYSHQPGNLGSHLSPIGFAQVGSKYPPGSFTQSCGSISNFSDPDGGRDDQGGSVPFGAGRRFA